MKHRLLRAALAILALSSCLALLLTDNSPAGAAAPTFVQRSTAGSSNISWYSSLSATLVNTTAPGDTVYAVCLIDDSGSNDTFGCDGTSSGFTLVGSIGSAYSSEYRYALASCTVVNAGDCQTAQLTTAYFQGPGAVEIIELSGTVPFGYPGIYADTSTVSGDTFVSGVSAGDFLISLGYRRWPAIPRPPRVATTATSTPAATRRTQACRIRSTSRINSW